jgi:hypothetical protein
MPIVHAIAALLIVLFGFGALCLANHYWRENEKLRARLAVLEARPRPMPVVRYLGEQEEEKHGQNIAAASR